MELTVTPKPVKKIQQVVWLEPLVFAKVAELSAKLNVAPNVIIAEIVKKYLESGVEPIKVVEKTVEVPVGFYCPVCLKRFTLPSDLIDHIRGNEECRKKIVE
ncbi:MAG: C2H2-type zinc finger protein [Candidatus Nezhaarchaeales archaeon]